MDNSATWSALMPRLVEEWGPGEVEVVCIDLPGHGRSSWLPPGRDERLVSWCSYQMEDYLPPLLSLVHDCLCWDYFTLAGHSMGAALAILLSVALPPAAVRRLVLIEGMGPNSSVPGVHIHHRHHPTKPQHTAAVLLVPDY
jgi:pimeloyl-ACP methyl ester carboxylesterase